MGSDSKLWWGGGPRASVLLTILALGIGVGAWLASPGRLLDTSGFPPRWQCGEWEASLGWMHVLSDIAIFGAYAAIPCVLLHFVRRRRDVPFSGLFVLFGAFIFACGLTHLLDAIIFWQPVYRLAGVAKLTTALVSWMTVAALIPLVPRMLSLPGLAAANANLQREIDERRAAEARAEEARRLSESYLSDSVRAEQRAHRVIEAAPSAMIAVDRDGLIVLANSLAEEMFGYSRDELLNQPVEQLIPEGARGPHVKLRNKFFDAPEARAMGAGRDLFARRSDGTEFPVEIGLNPIDMPEGPIVLGAILDITQRKHDEQLLRQTVAELADTNRELEQFAYMASHDLQEPLRKMVSFAALLVEDLGEDLPDSASTDLGFMVDAAQRMQGLVKGLLHLSRAGRGEKRDETVALDACVDDALDTLAGPIADSRARIERDPLPEVVGDRSLLTTLFQNLLGNSLKFVPADRPPQVRITASRSSGDWEFAIEDNGIGVDAQYAESIFEPFRRLHSRAAYEGTGIGLAICKKAVERHGGKIWVESAPGAGARFCFTLTNVLSLTTD